MDTVRSLRRGAGGGLNGEELLLLQSVVRCKTLWEVPETMASRRTDRVGSVVEMESEDVQFGVCQMRRG